MLDNSEKLLSLHRKSKVMANHLPPEKKALITQLLCEGNSIRATARIAEVSFNTVLKWVPIVGEACLKFHNEKVRKLHSSRVQCDEIWAFCYSKQKNVELNKAEVPGAGDIWTWTAIDADSKVIISWLVGDRSKESAEDFLFDLRKRIEDRIQLTTDGHNAYKNAVCKVFGTKNIDYAQLIKKYGDPGSENPTERKYSPAECTGIDIVPVAGNPNPIYVSTSYVERSNLSIRMGNRRFTRLTNAFSKKIENHMYAVALYVVYYNWVRIHKTLRTTPAMEAGITKKLMEFSDIVKLTEIYPANSK